MLIIRFLLRFYNYFISPERFLARKIRQMTGFTPSRLSIFKLAFSHKSNQSTKDFGTTNNERLEYLGDAVLGTIVAEYLFKKYPNANEGFLTKMRSKIVKRKSLNYIGDEMGLDVLLNEYNNTRLSSSMLGNAVEALVGAIYLEKGYEQTKNFIIERMLKKYIDVHELENVDDNYKSQLLEHCQKKGQQVFFKLVKKYKVDKRDCFKVAIEIDEKEIAVAVDFNKKAAEQLASSKALVNLGILDKKKAKNAISRIKTPSLTKSTKAEPTQSISSKKKKANAKQTTIANTNKKIKQTNKTEQTTIVEKKTEKSTQELKINSKKGRNSSSKIISPPEKKKFNYSPLGKAIWKSIYTGAVSIDCIDTNQPFKPVYRFSETTSKPVDNVQKVATIEKTDFISEKNNVKDKRDLKNSNQKSNSKKKATATKRIKRPVPLRLLNPIIKDISIAASIDWLNLDNKDSVPQSQLENQQESKAKAPRRKTRASYRAKQNSNADKSNSEKEKKNGKNYKRFTITNKNNKPLFRNKRSKKVTSSSTE